MPERSPSSKARPAHEIRASAISWAISPTTVSAIRLTRAPADSSSSTLRAAGSPPPTTSTGRSCSVRKMGKVCIIAGRHAACRGRAARSRARISGRQEPQLVPALVTAPTASSVIAPLAIAVCTEAQDTPRQAQISPPRSAASPPCSRMRRCSRVELGHRHERRQPIARGLVVRLADAEDRFEPAVADDGAQAFLAVEPLLQQGPGFAVRIAADSARRATAKGCSPASR